MKKIITFVALLATISGFSQTTDSTEVNKLDEVKLESQRYIKSKKRATQQIESISAKEIEFQNFQTTADVLASSGKLSVQKSQQGGGSPVIRGLESNRILLLVDGVRMNNLIFRGGHLQNVITVDENMLQNADILFGSSSTAYGSDAMGGAINLVTKSPYLFSQNNNRKFSGNLNTRYGSVNKEKSGYGDFRYSGEKWATFSAFSYNDFGDLKMGSKKNGKHDNFGERPYYVETVNGKDEIVKNPDPLVQKFSGYKQYNAMQKILFQPNSTTQHNLNLQYSTTTDIPRYDRLTDLKGNGTLKTATWNYGPQKRILAGYKFTKEKALLNSDLTIGANYQNIEESRISRDFGKAGETSRVEKVAVYSINADLKTKIGQGELLYGVEAFYDDLNSSASKLDVITGEVSAASTRYPDGKNFTMRTDAFVTYFSKLNEKTSYTFGARGGFVKLHSDIVDNSFFNLPFTKIEQKNFTYSGAVGIVSTITEHIKVASNISSGFRTPNIDDLAKVFESTSGNLIVPNSNLKPEKNITGDVSLTLFDNGVFELENTVFYTRLFDVIVTDHFLFNGQSTVDYEGEESTVLANQNLGKAEIFGYSTKINVKLYRSLNFYGNFSYTYGRINGGSNAGQPLDHIPPFYGKTGFNFESKWVNLDLNMIYNGKKDLKDYSSSGEDNLVYAPKNGTHAWQTFNFKAAVKPIKYITVYAGIENIFDTQYRAFASGINAAGQNIYVGTKISL